MHAASEPHVVSGQDLDIGGHGMVGFYDKMLPSYANKLGKKYGAQAEKTTVNIGTLTGKALVKKLREVMTNDAGTKEILNQVARVAEVNNVDPVRAFKTIQNSSQPPRANAQSWAGAIRKIDELRKAQSEEVWSLKITPEMRKAIMSEGQPLFSAPPVPPFARATRDKTRGDDQTH